MFDNRSSLRIVMEACGSAHYWARRFTRFGDAVDVSVRATPAI